MTLFPPLLALFATRFGLSLVEASLLPMTISVFGNMPQPMMGYLGDKNNRMILAALGVFCCGLFVSIIGFAPSAPVLALFLVFAALGSSLFHPTGGGLVTASLPGRSNLAMAIFLTGGPLGMAIAPVAGTQIIQRYGLEQLWITVFPAIVAAAFLLRFSRSGNLGESTTKPVRISLAFLKTSEVRPLWTLFAISVFRSFVHATYISFISFLGQSRGWNISEIGWTLSAYLVCITMGRIVGGYLGDRISPRKLLGASCGISACFFIPFCFTTGVYSLVLFFLAGFIFDLGATTNIVLAQKVLPQNTSTATGMVMGFSWGVGGILMPFVALLADATSISVALAAVSSLLLPAALLVGALPKIRPQSLSQAGG
jgi:FSR family fosmidomycin resistance protein-like MFS transporter